MSLVGVEARNASLSMSYGAATGPAAPMNLEVALYVGDPADGGTELAATGGYAAALVDNDGTTWPDAPVDGAVTSAAVTFPTSSAAWAESPTHYLIRDADTADEWDSGLLSDEVSVLGAGVIVAVQLTVFYNDLV